MRRVLWITGIVAVLGVGGAVWLLRAMGEAEFWEFEIAAFEEADRAEPPPAGAVLFTGSSSVRLWESLAADMAPLVVLNRGFGGAHLDHVNLYAPRIVLPYEPRAVVLYAGDNDIGSGDATPESLLADFRRFVAIVWAALPGTPIYFVSIKPSRLRWSDWPVMARANALIEAEAAGDPRLGYIDISAPMLGADGEPRGELFAFDGLHLSKQGYGVWTRAIRPVLLADLRAE